MAEPILKKGSSDPAVRDLQEALKALGYDVGSVDGVFGAKTESAVKKFQQVFSPGIFWSGLSLNRSGWEVQHLQMNS